jgi:hypothetical protein
LITLDVPETFVAFTNVIWTAHRDDTLERRQEFIGKRKESAEGRGFRGKGKAVG